MPPGKNECPNPSTQAEKKKKDLFEVIYKMNRIEYPNAPYSFTFLVVLYLQLILGAFSALVCQRQKIYFTYITLLL